MGYKWLPVTEDFDKTLVIKKWRFDVSIPISGNYDGALSELPNIDIKTCWNNSQPENGYAFSNRFNLGQKYFSSRYYGWTDHFWTATTEANTTLVSGTTYEFECPVDLYWAGVRESTFDNNIPNYMWLYVQATFETDVTAITASYSSTTCAVTITTEEETEWTASTSNNWITISPNQGTGSSVFVVTINKNTNYASRTGLITITNNDGDEIEIDVSQEKYPLFVPKNNIYRGGNRIN